MTNKTSPHHATGTKKKISIKVFGIGGAGTNIVAHMIHGGFPGVAFAVADTSQEAFASSPASETFALDGKLMRRLHAASTADEARAVFGDQLARLQNSCAGADVVFIIAGLGGRTAKHIGPVVAQIAKDAGALVLAFVTTPFDYEGSRRHQLARNGLERLKAAADGVICLPNQRLFKLIDRSTSLVNTYRIADELLANGVRGIWRLLTYTALIEIHFADLCSLVRDRHEESAFAVAEATGPERAREVMEELLRHPMLDGGQMLSASDTVLVSLMGGPDLTTIEVSQVMEQINRQCENAHVIMGAAIDAEFADRLAVIVIATRGAESESPEPEASAAPAATRLRSPVNETELGDSFMTPAATGRPGARCVPPPPALTPEKMEQLFARQSRPGSRSRKGNSKMRQGQLPLEVVSKGRFDKSEPTIYKGEDLDLPTYIRRGMVLN